MGDAPAHVSYSQLSSWVRCGKAYELERVIRVPSAPTWAMVAGSAVHTGTEHLDRGATGPVRDLWLDTFAGTIEDYAERTGTDPGEWRATGRRTRDKPRGEDHRFWKSEGAMMLQRYKAWRLANKDKWKIAQFTDSKGEPVDAIELPLGIKFGEVLVQAFVDRVFIGPDDDLIVVDIKSGAYAPKDGGQQTGLYATGIEQLFGVRPRWGAYWMARAGEFAEPPKSMDHFSTHYWTSAVEKFALAKQENIYLPNPGMFCGSCSVRDYCATMGGHLAPLADTLSTVS